MATKIFALVTEQGTAMAETALCGDCHQNPRYRDERCLIALQDPECVSSRWIDCSENEMLNCMYCGAPEQPTCW